MGISDFKVGDRVEVIHDLEGDVGIFYVGKQGTVYLVTEDHIEVEIDDDDGESYFSRDELKLLPSGTRTPEQKIADLEEVVNSMTYLIENLESSLYNLTQEVGRKAGDYHDHPDLERLIRDTEYHTHHEYARERHTHDRWDLR